ncbi:MAG TPA: hypothetical protein VGE74_14035, partial [Gemmata sp.]
SRATIRGRDQLGGREVLHYGTETDSDPGDSGGGVFVGRELVGVHCGKSYPAPGAKGVPHATATGPVRRFLAKVLRTDGGFSAKPAPVPVTKADPPGTLRTASGRLLVPNGNGTYRYADEPPLKTIPAAPSCPNGRCPLPR